MSFQVLIVDDVRVNVHMLARLVAAVPDVETRQFTDPDAALGWSADADVDLAIIDYHMPTMSGADFVAAFRNGGRNRDTPIIVVTAERAVEVRHQCLRAGATDFLCKPIDGIEVAARGDQPAGAATCPTGPEGPCRLAQPRGGQGDGGTRRARGGADPPAGTGRRATRHDNRPAYRTDGAIFVPHRRGTGHVELRVSADTQGRADARCRQGRRAGRDPQQTRPPDTPKRWSRCGSIPCMATRSCPAVPRG